MPASAPNQYFDIKATHLRAQSAQQPEHRFVEPNARGISACVHSGSVSGHYSSRLSRFRTSPPVALCCNDPARTQARIAAPQTHTRTTTTNRPRSGSHDLKRERYGEPRTRTAMHEALCSGSRSRAAEGTAENWPLPSVQPQTIKRPPIGDCSSGGVALATHWSVSARSHGSWSAYTARRPSS